MTIDNTLQSLDYKRYLHELGFDAPPLPTLANLRQLQFAHLQRYPFQSLSAVLDQPIELATDIMFQKVVINRQGGYCYELNGLFLALLTKLGYQARPVTGYVLSQNSVAQRHARTHMLLLVTIDHVDYTVDVGFGGLVPTAPLRLVTDVPQPTAHGEYRLTQYNSYYILSTKIKSDWLMLYMFDLQEQSPIDLEVGNWYVSTHPNSPLKARLMASMIDANGGRHTLLNNVYKCRNLDQSSETIKVTSKAQLIELLVDKFNMQITMPELEGLTLFDNSDK